MNNKNPKGVSPNKSKTISTTSTPNIISYNLHKNKNPALPSPLVITSTNKSSNNKIFYRTPPLSSNNTRFIVPTINTVASNLNNVNYDIDKIKQVQNSPKYSINNVDNNLNFAAITAKENTPNRKQAIVEIGKIVQPKNITFVSRILNNRFCIFFLTKKLLSL